MNKEENQDKIYESAGVDIQAANETLKAYAKLAKKTMNSNVLSDIGPFGAAFKLANYKNPVLISSTDGVGTKLLLAKTTNSLKMMGEDLVNHCVNDVMCAGALPLFFLDYIGAGPDLSQNDRIELVDGMTKACKENNVALIGGETADLPDLYLSNAFDIVGFMVGAVEQDDIIDGTKMEPGDQLYAVPSNGLQTNGFTMIRKIWNLNGSIEHDSSILSQNIEGLDKSLGRALMQPHLSYKDIILKIIETDPNALRGIAHITGGGIALNLERIIPENLSASVNLSNFTHPSLYKIIKEQGDLTYEEMFEVFNMGIGIIFVINNNIINKIKHHLNNLIHVGEISSSTNNQMKVKVISEHL